jgi:uncharacterized protein (TIGR02466 family)
LKSSKIELWHDAIHSFDLSDYVDNQAIIEHCHEVRKEDPEGIIRSNVGGWQKAADRRINPALDHMYDVAEKHINELCRRDFLMDQFLRMSYGWFNSNKGGDYNQDHTHPGAVLAAVYYIKQKPEQGGVRFTRHESFSFGIHQTIPEYMEGPHLANQFKSSEVYMPREYELIVFPAWLAHSVEPNRSDEERLNIAMNFADPYNI